MFFGGCRRSAVADSSPPRSRLPVVYWLTRDSLLADTLVFPYIVLSAVLPRSQAVSVRVARWRAPLAWL